MKQYLNQNQQKIIQTIQQIPAGCVASYGQLADLAGLPGRARLVGKVLRTAPDDFKLPWYRILRANGALAFSAGSEQAMRQIDRLAEEGVEVIRNKVDMKTYGWQPSLADILFKLEQ